MVVQSILYGIIGSAGFGASDLLAAGVARRISVFNLVLGSDLLVIVLASAYLPFAPSMGDLSLAQWGSIAGLGVFTLAITLLFYIGLRIGPVAVVTPIVSANTIIVLLMAAWILGERLAVGQSISTGIAIVGVAFASTDIRNLLNKGNPVSKGVLIALVIMVGGGVWTFYIGVLSKELGWFLPIYLSRIVTVLVLIPIQLYRKQVSLRSLTLKQSLLVGLVGVLETGGMFAVARGMEIGTISVIAATLTLYPVIPIVGGILLFKEKLALYQIGGLTLVLAGLLSLGLTS